MKQIPSIIVALGLVVFLGACSAVRHCKAPELDLPKEIVPGAADTLTLADVEWWRFYGDSALRDIIRRTLDHNRNIRAAAAHVEQMRQLYRIRKAERLPSLGVNVLADHETNDYYGESSKLDPNSGSRRPSAGSSICGATCAGPNGRAKPSGRRRSRTNVPCR